MKINENLVKTEDENNLGGGVKKKTNKKIPNVKKDNTEKKSVIDLDLVDPKLFSSLSKDAKNEDSDDITDDLEKEIENEQDVIINKLLFLYELAEKEQNKKVSSDEDDEEQKFEDATGSKI